MDDKNNPAKHKADSEQANYERGKDRIQEGDPSTIKQPDSQKNGDDSTQKPKPAILVRFWHGLWRKRIFLHRRKNHISPNWAEKTSMYITCGIMIAAFIQAAIYWEQATLMNTSIDQNERSIILGGGQLVVAGKNEKIAEDTFKNSQKAFDIQTRPWIGFSIKDIEIRRNPPNASIADTDPNTRVRFDVKVNYTITNYGPSPALDVVSKFQWVSANDIFNPPNRKAICDKAIRDSTSDTNKIENYFGRNSVFPTQTIDKFIPDNSIPDISFLFDQTHVRLIGCFAYHGIVGEKTHTTFVDFSFPGKTPLVMDEIQSKEVTIRKIDAQ